MKLFLNICCVIALTFNFTLKGQIYKDPSASLQERVEDLLSQMTLDEKIGQMAQAERSAVISNNIVTTFMLGSVLSGGGSAPSNNSPEGWANLYDQLQEEALATRLGIPIIYGIDAIHGHNNLYGATLFPHNIGMGCTRNLDLVELATHITAIEVAATGLDWTFSPCVTVPQNELWGRTFEGFSENADIVKTMAAAAIRGYQGDTLSDSTSIISCAKHFLGDGGTTGGIDRGNTEISEDELRAVHLPGYIEAINNGVATVMVSFSSWNGLKMHENKYLITDVLKTELGFKGPVISDWNAIQQLSGTYKEKVKKAIDAGIDIAMETNSSKAFLDALRALVNEGQISESRINDAVRRILSLKFEAGIFEHPYANRTMFDSVGNEYHRAVARQCVRESMVMLKKRDDLLPLKKEGLKIHVAGSNADDLGNQCGGWAVSWQGSSGNITLGTTIYEGLQEVAPDNDYYFTEDASDWQNEDIGIVVIGEKPYAEYIGDRSTIDNLISQADVEAVKRMKSYGIPVIVIMVTGRPVNITDIYPYADAIFAAWLPGTEGQGIAELVFGNYIPTGKLSFSWPRNNIQIPVNYGDIDYNPLYSFDYGLTSFENSTPKSMPLLYSAAVDSAGLYVECSFNKKMMESTTEMDHFQLFKNQTITSISSVDYSPLDSFRIRLYVTESILSDDQLLLNYVPGNLMSADSGIVAAIDNFQVINHSEVKQTELNHNQIGKSISLFPNPASDGFYIKTRLDSETSKIELFNSAGLLIKQEERFLIFQGSQYIDMSNMPAGIYFVRISNLNEIRTILLEFIKQ
jgi:beta-glucosidase